MNCKLYCSARFAKLVAIAVMGTLALASLSTSAYAARWVSHTALNAPTASFTVKVVDPDCQRSGEPVEVIYPSVDEAVKDTVPGEWWPASGYSCADG